MPWTTKAQLPKYVTWASTFKEISCMPPLEMGRATYQWSKKGLEAL
jgi:hypothetical protein